ANSNSLAYNNTALNHSRDVSRGCPGIMVTETENWLGLKLAAGRYEVLKQLGEGGMGYAYLARDHTLEREVVLKVPRRSLFREGDFAGRFSREIRALARLEHPNIVKVMDTGEHEGLPFIVLAYLPGGNLRQRQLVGPDNKPSPRPLLELADWVEGIAAALDFIHQQKFIHRDIKPDNI